GADGYKPAAAKSNVLKIGREKRIGRDPIKAIGGSQDPGGGFQHSDESAIAVSHAQEARRHRRGSARPVDAVGGNEADVFAPAAHGHEASVAEGDVLQVKLFIEQARQPMRSVAGGKDVPGAADTDEEAVAV